MDLRFGLVLVCFALSGFAALLYETAWVRQFAFVFGTSDLAVATVLAAYFGGLTAGAVAAARFIDRIKRPVLVYGLLELGIAILALGVPLALDACTRLYLALFGGQSAPPGSEGISTALFYLVCAFVILMAPTAMMGATLPLLAKYAVRSDQELGRRVGWLYAINTIGAVGGTLCAAFVFLPALGLSRTVLVGVGVNALVFVLATVLAMGAPPQAVLNTSSGGPLRQGRRFGLVLPLILLSGVASFAYEVMWTRLLSQILGASVYAFATMLASFLVGITLGAAIAVRLARTHEGSARAFGWVQIGVGVLSLGAFTAIDRLPAMANLIDAGATGNFAANALLAMTILVPGALCMGAAYPLAVRTLARDESDAGPVSAQVYAWNTVGAILGAIGTGFFILPWLGFAGTLWAVVTLNLLIAVMACTLAKPVSVRLGLVAACCGVALAVFRPGEPWGVLRYSPLTGQSNVADSISYYGVGRSATVLLLDDGLRFQLRSGGLPEALIPRAAPIGPMYQEVQWLSALPVLARPNARDMLMIGLGGGNATAAVPACISEIDVIELEPRVVEANQSVSMLRSVDPLSDPRVRLIVNDARGALLLTDRKYDAIVSQPSHPWTSGASHLYTREFFKLVRDHLVDDGVFVQWIGLAFVDEDLLKSLVGTLYTAFPHVRVYQPVPMEVVFVAAGHPLPVEESCVEALSRCGPDLANSGIVAREDVAAALVLDNESARQFSQGAMIITDDYNLLQMRSVRTIRGHRERPAQAYFDAYRPELPESLGLNRFYMVRRSLFMGMPARAYRHAQAMSPSDERAVAIALSLAGGGRPAEGARTMVQALELYPQSPTVQFAALAQRRLNQTPADERARAIMDLAVEPYRAVFEGWAMKDSKDWAALRQLEGRLAHVDPLADYYADALRLRAAWRIHSADEADRSEAKAMIDELTARFAQTVDYLLRAEAAVKSGAFVEALTALHDAVHRVGLGNPARQVARSVAILLDEIPNEDQFAPARRRIKERINLIFSQANPPPAAPAVPQRRPMIGQ